MGQKVNPEGFRLGVVGGFSWRSNWFADKKSYKDLLFQDIILRKKLLEKLKLAGVMRVNIERSPREIRVRVIVSRPGMVIGRAGTGTEELKKYIFDTLNLNKSEKPPKIDLIVEEVKDPETSAYLVSGKIVEQLIRRMPHRRVVKKAMERVISAGAKGIKVVLGGRINGAEIARRESYHLGKIPLQTLRANIDYFSNPALTKSGYIGVKVWIYKGESPIA
jgi:small subunit ribosomal protein S3